MLQFSLAGVKYETGGVTITFRRLGRRDIARSLHEHGLDDVGDDVARETKTKMMEWHTQFVAECITDITDLVDCETKQPIIYDDMTITQKEKFIEYLFDEDDGFAEWIQGYMSGAKKKSIEMDEGEA